MLQKIIEYVDNELNVPKVNSENYYHLWIKVGNLKTLLFNWDK